MGINKVMTMFVLGTALFMSGCFDADIRMKILTNGSGEIELRYAIPFILIEEYGSKFVETERNKLLVRTKEEAVELWGDNPDLTIVDYAREDRAMDATGKVGFLKQLSGFRRSEVLMDFKRLDALDTGHIDFEFYAYGDARYFAFRISKKLMSSHLTQDRGGMGMFTANMVAAHKIRLTVNLPSAVQDSNGTRKGRSDVSWDIPIAAFVNGVQDEFVGWAKLPAPQEGFVDKGLRLASESFTTESWKKPKKLAPYFLLPMQEPLKKRRGTP